MFFLFSVAHYMLQKFSRPHAKNPNSILTEVSEFPSKISCKTRLWILSTLRITKWLKRKTRHLSSFVHHGSDSGSTYLVERWRRAPTDKFMSLFLKIIIKINYYCQWNITLPSLWVSATASGLQKSISKINVNEKNHLQITLKMF